MSVYDRRRTTKAALAFLIGLATAALLYRWIPAVAALAVAALIAARLHDEETAAAKARAQERARMTPEDRIEAFWIAQRERIARNEARQTWRYYKHAVLRYLCAGALVVGGLLLADSASWGWLAFPFSGIAAALAHESALGIARWAHAVVFTLLGLVGILIGIYAVAIYMVVVVFPFYMHETFSGRGTGDDF